MNLQIGLCFSYAVAAGGVGGEQRVLYGRLIATAVDGSWVAAPLLLLESLHPSLIPVDPDDDALRKMDSAIRIIPAMVLDARVASRWTLDAPSLLSLRAILVANEHWFRADYVLYRGGMHGVYRVWHQFVDGQPAGTARTCKHICFLHTHAHLPPSRILSFTLSRRRSSCAHRPRRLPRQ
jgi:hypothetical protein